MTFKNPRHTSPAFVASGISLLMHSATGKLITPTLLFLMCFAGAKAQDMNTQQHEAIYKTLKVSARKSYTGDAKTPGTTFYYDKNGRIIKTETPENSGTKKVETYYKYDNSGKLVHQVDTVRRVMPSAISKKKKNDAAERTLLAGQPAETAFCDFFYTNNNLVRRKRFNTDGTLRYLDNFSDNGKTQIRDWFGKEGIYKQDTTRYLTENHIEQFSGWELEAGKRKTWDFRYTYEFENGNVKKCVRSENGLPKETTTFHYSADGLLQTIKGHEDIRFEYVFY